MIIWGPDESVVMVITNDDGVTTKCANLETLDADLAKMDEDLNNKLASMRRLILVGG